MRSISSTTRKRRKGEQGGRDYFFISRGEFLKQKAKKQFLEWAEVLGNFYGTPLKFVQEQLERGTDVILSIDVQGAQKIKRKVKNAVFIFVLPPSVEELQRRLKARSTENRREIAGRLKLARWEIKQAKHYDYAVLNDNLDKALRKLKKIIAEERKE